MIDSINVEGLTTFQLDSLLNNKYTLFYEQPFVKTKVISNRVVVLGAAGNSDGQVIPLTDDDISLIEILALAGGLPNNAKATNIRLIRGDLSNPEVYLINLKTIEGMQQATLNVQPNDIIYIEPVRKVIVETSRDIAPVAALFTSMVTLLVLIINVTKDN